MSRMIEEGMPQINLAVMIGFPSDTKESIKATRQNLDLMMDMRNDIVDGLDRQVNTHINFSIFTATPFPGTPYFEETLQSKRMEYDIEEHPELWNLYTSVVRGDTFSAAESTNHRRELLSAGHSVQSGGKVALHLSEYADKVLERKTNSKIERCPIAS